MAPAVSQAKPIAINAKTKAGTCEVLRLTAGLWQEAAENAEAKGETDMAA